MRDDLERDEPAGLALRRPRAQRTLTWASSRTRSRSPARRPRPGSCSAARAGRLLRECAARTGSGAGASGFVLRTPAMASFCKGPALRGWATEQRAHPRGPAAVARTRAWSHRAVARSPRAELHRATSQGTRSPPFHALRRGLRERAWSRRARARGRRAGARAPASRQARAHSDRPRARRRAPAAASVSPGRATASRDQLQIVRPRASVRPTTEPSGKRAQRARRESAREARESRPGLAGVAGIRVLIQCCRQARNPSLVCVCCRGF